MFGYLTRTASFVRFANPFCCSRNSPQLAFSHRPRDRQDGADRGQVQEDQGRELRQVPRQDRRRIHDQEGART